MYNREEMFSVSNVLEIMVMEMATIGKMTFGGKESTLERSLLKIPQRDSMSQ